MDILYLPLVIFTIIILAYVVYQDIKYREINILSLVILAIVSIIYLGVFIFKNNLLLWYNYIFQIFVTFLFLLIFFLLGKISSFTYIGEGDLYILLSLVFTNIYGVFFIMFIFIFALLITLLIPIGIFIYNLYYKNYSNKKLLKHAYLMFLGYPLKLNKINSFYTPLEAFSIENNKIKRIIKIKPNIEPEKELSKVINFAKKHNISRIWVSPLIPFAIFIFFSYLLMFFLYSSGIIYNFLNLFL